MTSKQLFYSCLLFFITISNHSFSQATLLETWPIGDPYKCFLIFFNDGSYTVDTTHNFSYRITGAVGIANDTNGNLAFMCNGSRIANSQLQILENGDSITDNGFYDWAYPGTGIPQSVIVMPRANNTYWVFYYSYYDSAANSPSPDRLYYAIVDMNANNGAGRVTVKKQAIYKGVMGDCRLTAVRHANGRDWWLVNHAYNNNIYNKWLVSPDSIYGPYQQAIGASDAEPDLFGSAQFSPDGTHYASGTIGSPMNIMDFDRCTGEFSNPISINVYSEEPWTPSTTNSVVDGLCWSPSGRFLYVTTLKYLLQYDTWADTIENTRTLIAKVDSTYNNTSPFFTMAISPHGKIIIANYQGVSPLSNLHVISQPDSLGLSCSFQKEQIGTFYESPSFYNDHYYLPNLANLKLGADSTSLCDTIPSSIQNYVAATQFLRVFPNPATDWLFIELPNEPNNIELSILNLSGQTVYSKTFNISTRIQLVNWSNGIYFYKLKTKQYERTGKFMVEH